MVKSTDEIIDAEEHHLDAPPTYTPRVATPQTPIYPPPSSETPPRIAEVVPPERIHAPTAPFSTDLTLIGPEPANVICPRCHYGVRTSTQSSPGTHAG
jgi:hypothetical protein